MHPRTFVGKIILLAMIGVSGAHANDVAKTDRQLTQQVKLLIGQHPEFGNQLTVWTRKGVVNIGGTPWTHDISYLEPLVRQIDGVAKVVVTAVYPEN